MSNRSRPKAKGHRPNRPERPRLAMLPRNDRQLTRSLSEWMRSAELQIALDWLIHGASEEQRAGIKVYSTAVAESVLSTYAPLNDDLVLIVQQRISAAATLDAMADAEYGDSSGAELTRTLAKLNSELARKPRPVTR